MSEYAEVFRRHVLGKRRAVRRARIARTDETRLAEAAAMLGADAERHRRRAWRWAREVRVLIAERDEADAAKRDCAGQEFMEAEVGRTLHLARAPRERTYGGGPDPRREHDMMMERKAARQRRRAVIALSLPEDPEWRKPRPPADDAEAEAILAAEVVRLSKRLKELSAEIYETGCTCGLPSCIIPDSLFEVVCPAAGMTSCKKCRAVAWEASSIKDDISNLTAGMMTLKQLDIGRKPGRSKER